MNSTYKTPHSTKPPTRSHLRRRGVILTSQGLKKLNQAKTRTEVENSIRRYTLESLSEKTGLTPNTLSKVFATSAGVDIQTLHCCFRAFNLTLDPEDYQFLEAQAGHQDDGDQQQFTLIPATEIPSKDLLSRTNKANGASSTISRNGHRHPLSTNTSDQIKPSSDSTHDRSPIFPGGQLSLESHFYIHRPPIEALCHSTIQQPGMLINIRAPKQMGKTSLKLRILAYAETLHYETVSLNLQLADAEIFQSLENLLQWFCMRVVKKLGLPPNLGAHWNPHMGSKSNATDYFEEVVLSNLDRPIVIAIDEINQLFSYPKIANEFLELLRVWSEQAKAGYATSNPWHHLRLITVYSTEIQMPYTSNSSLLDTGLIIEIPELTHIQVQELAEHYGQTLDVPQVQALMTLIGGNPYRLQLAFYHLYKQTITLKQLLQGQQTVIDLYAEHLQRQWWNLQRYPDLWFFFTQVIEQTTPVDCGTETGFQNQRLALMQLRRMGLVHQQGNCFSLACELFRPFFRDYLPSLNC